MAMSFSRPDPSSPAQVADASFSTQRRGFDQSEVRDFLRMVSAELGRLHERERFLERELSTAQANPDLDTVKLDDEALTRLLGEETARVLTAARVSGQEIREKAEQAAARMLAEASDEATRLREEAELEASRRRADATSDAEAELSMAKQQGREMVEEARAYRERVLSELARRRELAREQIEQLIHGRDRLMQSFERARLVAVDVVSELQPLGEPDEYVNLQPSTGPVPVMVARDDLRRSGDAEVETPEVEADDETAALGSDVDEASDDAAIFDDTADDLRIIDATDSADDTDASEAEDIDPDAVGDVVDAEFVQVENESPVDADADADAESPVTDADVEAGVEPEQADAEVGDPDQSGDDVVVDLFARLRADNVDAVDGESEIGEPADAASGVTGTVIGSAVEESLDSEADELEPDPADAEPAAISLVDDAPDADETLVGETPFSRRDAELTPLIVGAARKLKRVLADEQNEVLDALRRSDPIRNLDGLLPWASQHGERYSASVADELLSAAQAGAAALDSDGAADTPAKRAKRLRPAAGRDAVEGSSEALVAALVEPLRDRLDRCIADGDGDNPVITKKVRAIYREWKTQRIDEVVDDVVRTAHGRGVLAAIDLDQPVEWLVDPDARCCSDCDDNELAGATAAGQAFPTGHVCTPAHPGCRCTLLPANG